MRLCLLATLALGLAAAPRAQIDRGVISVGGSASVFISPTFFIVLSPSAGYFVSPKVQVGANPTVVTDFENFSAYITGFASYYPTGGTPRRTYPFVGTSLGVSLTDEVGLAIGARAGVQHFLSESAALSLSLNGVTTEDFDLETALLSLNAGFSIFLRR